MASDKILSLTSLLEEIKNKSEYCLKYNEQTQALIDKEFQDIKGKCPVNETCDYENSNETNSKDLGGKAYEEFDYLENILLEKMQENAKLKTLNERLSRCSREKAHKIKDLSRKVSLQNQRKLKFGEVSMYKDKVGKYNVEIQKLKKQLDIETGKLHNEETKAARLKKSSTSLNGGQKKSPEIAKKAPSVNKITKHSLATERSFEDLDEVFVVKTLVMIRLNKEPNINDEIFDEPENLDSDADEELSNEMFKELSAEMFMESSEEPLEESTDADIEFSS